MDEDKIKKGLEVFFTAYLIFLIGVQIGINEGRKLHEQEVNYGNYDYNITNQTNTYIKSSNAN